jgi:multidrug resistance efflux pump
MTIALLKRNLFDQGANFSNLTKEYEELGDTLTVTREERDAAESALATAKADVARMREALEGLMGVLNGPPLVTWEADWNKAMAIARAALNEGEGKVTL